MRQFKQASRKLTKLAREGSQMTAQHLRDLESTRRHATVVAVLMDAQATLTDEIIDMHDRILGALFTRAKKSHAERFQRSGKEIVLWNTVYLERAVQALKEHGVTVDDSLLTHLSPLGREHINLTGDYVWKAGKLQLGKFRPLRPFHNP